MTQTEWLNWLNWTRQTTQLNGWTDSTELDKRLNWTVETDSTELDKRLNWTIEPTQLA